MAARKQSIAASDGRRKSMYPRKPSIDGKQSLSLDVPVGMGRRPSMADCRRMSIVDFTRRQSMADSLSGRPGGLLSADKQRGMAVRYENTYKLDPDEKFPIYKAKSIAIDILEEHLNGKEYNKDECTRMSKTLTDCIKQQVKSLGFPRFKIIVIVAIGQNQESHPSLSFTSRCIWNDKIDNFAEATFKSKSIFAVALVYAMYSD